MADTDRKCDKISEKGNIIENPGGFLEDEM